MAVESPVFEFGAHVDKQDPLTDAAERGATIAQFFLGDPQSWKKPYVAYEGGAEALRQDAEAAGIGLYVHAPYIINVASTNNRIRIPSRKLLQQTVTLAAEVGARGVIVHGGHVKDEDDPVAGYTNWFKAVDGLTMDCPIFIENTAGGDHAMARYVDSIAILWQAISASKNIDHVGFCLDTCHAHASGEDLTTIVERIKAITGRIDLVHVNDSRDEQGSGRDRHANLGKGLADPDAIVAIVQGAGAPGMLETPGGIEEHQADLAWLRARVN